MVLGWISQQDGLAVLTKCGVAAAAFTAIVVAIRPIVRSRPVRWLGRVLFADPLAAVIHQSLDEWADRTWGPRIDGIEVKVDEVRAQFFNNGGTTMRDRVDDAAEAAGAPPKPKLHLPEH
jgi:hypothetical protein